MTREEILKSYKVNERGIIESLGRFEGEMLYVPYFDDITLDGGGLDEGNDWMSLRIEAQDYKEFPELIKGGADYIILTTSESGLIYGETMTKEEYEIFIKEEFKEEFEKDAQFLGKDSSEEEFVLWLEAFRKESIATEVIKIRDTILSEHEEVVNRIVNMDKKVYEVYELRSEFPNDVKAVAKELLSKNKILDTTVNSKLNAIEDLLFNLSK